MKSVCTYRDSDHSYKIDGRRVPSVTDILATMGKIDTTFYTEEGRDRGTRIHGYIATMARSGLPPIGPEFTEWLYCKAFSNFCHDVGFVRRYSEKKVWSARFGYAGRLDLVGDVRNRRALIDVKSGPLPGWLALQCAGYAIAASEQGIYFCDWYGLELHDDGSYKLRPVEDPATAKHEFLQLVKQVKEYPQWTKQTPVLKRSSRRSRVSATR